MRGGKHRALHLLKACRPKTLVDRDFHRIGARQKHSRSHAVGSYYPGSGRGRIEQVEPDERPDNDPGKVFDLHRHPTCGPRFVGVPALRAAAERPSRAATRTGHHDSSIDRLPTPRNTSRASRATRSRRRYLRGGPNLAPTARWPTNWQARYGAVTGRRPTPSASICPSMWPTKRFDGRLTLTDFGP